MNTEYKYCDVQCTKQYGRKPVEHQLELQTRSDWLRSKSAGFSCRHAAAPTVHSTRAHLGGDSTARENRQIEVGVSHFPNPMPDSGLQYRPSPDITVHNAPAQ